MCALAPYPTHGGPQLDGHCQLWTGVSHTQCLTNTSHTRHKHAPPRSTAAQWPHPPVGETGVITVTGLSCHVHTPRSCHNHAMGMSRSLHRHATDSSRTCHKHDTVKSIMSRTRHNHTGPGWSPHLFCNDSFLSADPKLCKRQRRPWSMKHVMGTMQHGMGTT